MALSNGPELPLLPGSWAAHIPGSTRGLKQTLLFEHTLELPQHCRREVRLGTRSCHQQAIPPPPLPPTCLRLKTRARAARNCRAEEALAHTWTSVARLAQDYPCREACTSDSRLQLGVLILCALWYISVSPK